MDLKRYKSKVEARNPSAKLAVLHDLAFQIGREIERIRMRHKLSQGELAEIIGTKQSGISRLERGDALPSVSTLKKIAEKLGEYVEIKFRLASNVAENPQRISETATLSPVQLKDLGMQNNIEIADNSAAEQYKHEIR